MRVFITGATGNIGSAVVHELIESGHEVVGLARTEDSAAGLRRAGAKALRGSLDDIEILRSGATASDGVIHMAFIHDFSNFEKSLKTDLHAIEAMGAALEGSGKPFIITDHRSGEASEKALFALANVRTSVVSLAPTVHGEGDKHGFVPQLIKIARAKGVSAYVADGSNRWPAVHRLDAANLYRLALEKAPAGSKLFGRAEEVLFRDIAAAIGRHLNLPVVSITRGEAEAHFGFLGNLVGLDMPSVIPASSNQTKELLGWHPVQPTLIEDLEQGHYFEF